MKKLFRLFPLIFTLVLFLMPFTVNAAKDTGCRPTNPKGLQMESCIKGLPEDVRIASDGVFPNSAYDTEKFFELEERIKYALQYGIEWLDIRDMNIGYEDYFNVIYFSYTSPYCGNGIDVSFWMDSESSVIADVEITNPMSPAETIAHIEKIDQKLNSIKALISESMTEEEKALVIHDYLVEMYEYDLNYSIYGSGDMFLIGKGVCQAYAYAFKYLTNLFGIECHVTVSEDMGHAWNIIKIDGSYYQTDCTWDDPVSDQLGRVCHDYFLISDEKMGEDHSGWDLTNLVCNSKKYDNAYWTDVYSPIVMDGDTAYYIDSFGSQAGIYKRNMKTLQTTLILGRDLLSSGLFMYNHELYYNTAEEIRKISTDGTNDSLFYRPPIDAGNNMLAGLRRNEDNIEYEIHSTIDWSLQERHTTPLIQKPEVPDIPFLDIRKNDWFCDSVRFNYLHRTMTGLDGTHFGPSEILSRAQFATILYRMEQSPKVSYEERFSDVPKDLFFTAPVMWASDKTVNIVTGYEDKTFGPSDAITREQMAVMMYRYAKFKQYDTSASASFDDFPDGELVSPFAKDAMKWAVGSKLITGNLDGMIAPQDTASRAVCATIIMRFMNMYE